MTPAQRRLPGFYWVHNRKGWIVAEWVKGPTQAFWLLTGDETIWCDDDFDTINEEQL